MEECIRDTETSGCWLTATSIAVHKISWMRCFQLMIGYKKDIIAIAKHEMSHYWFGIIYQANNDLVKKRCTNIARVEKLSEYNAD